MDAQADSQMQQAPEITPYQILGGAEGVRQLVDYFYDIMDSDPAVQDVRAMHAKDLSPMREKLSDYLSGWLGGPPLYFQRKDAACVMSAHAKFAINAEIAGQWMHCMRSAMARIKVPDPMRTRMDDAFTKFTEVLTNC